MKTLIILLTLFSFNAQAAMAPGGCAVLVVNELKVLHGLITGPAETQAIIYWTAICKGIINHIKTTADLNMQAGDISTPALGYTDTFHALPILGTAQSSAVILSTRIE